MVCNKQEGTQQHGRCRGDENIRAGHGVPIRDFTCVVNERKITAIGIILFRTKNSNARNPQESTEMHTVCHFFSWTSWSSLLGMAGV